MNMYPWQQKMFDQLTSGGVKPKEMVLMTAGRGVGKSLMNQQAIDRLMRDLMNRPVEDIILNEGKIHGARYYTAEPIGGNWREMEAWAIQTYGEVGSVWRADKWVEQPAQRWYMNDRRFWFRNEADRTMFVLKWR